MGRFFDTFLHRPVSDERGQRILALLEDAGDMTAILDQVQAELRAGDAPSEPVLAHVACALDTSGLDDDTRIQFWEALAARFPDHPYILACHGDALLAAARDREAVNMFLAAFRLAPALIQDFDAAADLACAQGGPIWLEYQLVELGAILDAAEAAIQNEGDVDLDIDVRERYSELLEEYYGDTTATAQIRELGKRIATLESVGVLPQSLVRRGDWRRD